MSAGALGLPGPCVGAAGENQLVVPAPLRHDAVPQNDYLVDEFEGGKPVRYQHRRAIGSRRKDVPHERVGRGLVQIGCGFVEDDRGEVGQQRARNEYAPTFTRGQSMAALPDVGLQAAGQALHPVEQAGAPEGVAQLIVVTVWAGQTKVLPDGRIEYVGILRAEADRAPDLVARNVSDIHAAKVIRTRAQLDESQ